MTLSALLAALSSNSNVNITLMESNDTQLITFAVGGYDQGKHIHIHHDLTRCSTAVIGG